MRQWSACGSFVQCLHPEAGFGGEQHARVIEAAPCSPCASGCLSASCHVSQSMVWVTPPIAPQCYLRLRTSGH
jgi:hypothetical protein